MYRSKSLSVLLWWQRISTELIDAFSMAQVSTICGLRGERIQTALWKPPHWKAGNYTLHMPTPDALDKFLKHFTGSALWLPVWFPVHQAPMKRGTISHKNLPKNASPGSKQKTVLDKSRYMILTEFRSMQMYSIPFRRSY